MGFLQPLVLLGLAAAAIPALLHLLERRTPPEQDFPAVRYLAETERRHAHRLRLRHLLLLALRTALVVLIVLAAARPLVHAGRAFGASGGHEPTAVVIVLDNSLSSGAVRDGVRALDRYRALARSSLGASTAADRLWLVLADGVVRRASRDEASRWVEEADVSPSRMDLSDAVAAAARAIANEPLPLAREVLVLSDLQATALGRASVPRGVRVVVLAPTPPPPNRGVDSGVIRDQTLALKVGGTPGAPAGSYRLRVQGLEMSRGMAEPGAGAAIALSARDAAPGAAGRWMVGEVELEPDELLGDNRRVFAWRAAPPVRVTVDSSSGPFVGVAVGVLTDAGRVVRGNEVTLGARLAPGTSVVVPPRDPALVGQLNRALAARGVKWRFEAVAGGSGNAGGRLEGMGVSGVDVFRRLALVGGDTADVLGTVAGRPWLVRAGDVVLIASRLEPEWTSLPTAPGFVPFVDQLVSRLARGEAPVRYEEGAPGVRFERSPTGDTLGAVVSGHDPRESDLRPATADGVREALGGGDAVELVSAESWADESFGGGRRTEITGLVLLLALLLAAAEWGVATFYR